MARMCHLASGSYCMCVCVSGGLREEGCIIGEEWTGTIARYCSCLFLMYNCHQWDWLIVWCMKETQLSMYFYSTVHWNEYSTVHKGRNFDPHPYVKACTYSVYMYLQKVWQYLWKECYLFGENKQTSKLFAVFLQFAVMKIFPWGKRLNTAFCSLKSPVLGFHGIILNPPTRDL